MAHFFTSFTILFRPLPVALVTAAFTGIDEPRLLVFVEVSDVLLHTTRSAGLLHRMVGLRLPLGIKGDLLGNSHCLA